MFDFFEFFAGGGMVRAGLGANWRCRFANDFDHQEERRLSPQLARRRSKNRRRARPHDQGFARSRRSRMGVLPMPGPFACRRRCRIEGRPIRHILAVLEPNERPDRRGTAAAHHRARKCMRYADLARRQGLRRDLFEF